MQAPASEVRDCGFLDSRRRILTPRENRSVGRAMLDYSMLAEGDRVLVAVSGGLDSQVLLWLLKHWQHKAPVTYTLHALHVDMAPEANTPGQAARRIAVFCRGIGVPLAIVPALQQTPAGDSGNKDVCFFCARSRRNQLFEFARQQGCSRIALGHHRDDLIETFLLNLLYSGNLSTMVPRQQLFSGALSLIRPLAYLSKAEVRAIAGRLGCSAAPSRCPLAEKTKRLAVRDLLVQLEATIPDVRERIFSALGNVRGEYLLNPHAT